jgi:hypothetical protein
VIVVVQYIQPPPADEEVRVVILTLRISTPLMRKGGGSFHICLVFTFALYTVNLYYK